MADVLLAREAEHVEDGAVGAQNRAVGTHPVQALDGVLEEVLELLRSRSRRLLGLREPSHDLELGASRREASRVAAVPGVSRSFGPR